MVQRHEPAKNLQKSIATPSDRPWASIPSRHEVLTSCGEEMTDDEFDGAIREIGQSSKGMFQLKKLLTSYRDLAAKVRRQNQANY